MAMLSKQRKINNDSTHIQDILSTHIHEFICPGFMNLVDSNIDQPEAWDKAKVRVLFCHLLPASEKVGGSVGSVVENIVISLLKADLGEEAVFVDVAYMPDKENFSLFEQYELPAWFGSSTHRSVLDFDAVMISNSTLEEKINIPWLLHHSGIPIWMTQRLKPENAHIPLIIIGGNSALTPDVYFGTSPDGKEQSWVDAVFSGHGEGIVNQIPASLIKTKDLPKEARIKDFFQFWNFTHPLAYQHEYKDSWRIAKTTKVIQEAPDKVISNKREDINNFPGSQRFIQHHGGQTGMIGSDVIVSWGCSSGGSCSFCNEGNSSGGWREKSLDKIQKEFETIRLSGMPEAVNFLSFNINYFKTYFKLIEMAQKVFGKTEMQASRVDTIAMRPEYFDLARKFGLQRMTVGYEGCSERLRNGYLNKQLAEKDFYKAWIAAASNRLMEIKVYMINTGLETNEDFDELVRVLDECYRLRDEIGSKTTLRVSFTNLCGYPNTPLAWEPRRPMIESILRQFPELAERVPAGGFCPTERNRFSHLLEQLRPRHIRFKFSSRGHITDLTQLTLDMGRKITPYLTKAALDYDMVYGVGMITKDKFRLLIDWLYDDGINMLEVAQAKPYDHVFPDQYVYTVNREYLKYCHKKAAEFKPVPFCLATPARPYKDPNENEVIPVNEVVYDGTKQQRTCLACGYCDTYTDDSKTAKEVRRCYDKRGYDTETHMDSVLATTQLNSPRERLYVKWMKVRKYNYLDPNTVWHYLWAKMMAEVARRYSVEEALKTRFLYEGPCKLSNKHNATDFSHGVYMHEVELRSKFLFNLDELKDIFNYVKPIVKASEFIDAHYVDFESSFPKDGYQMFIFRAKVQDPALREKVMAYDNSVRVLVKPMGGDPTPEFEIKIFPDLPKVLFFEGNPSVGSYILASFPCSINPQMMVSSITGENYINTCKNFEMRRLAYFTQGMRSCSVCKKPTFIDVYSHSDSTVCEECYRKALLIKIQKAAEVKAIFI